eukprot:8092938-Lingulodinium_polyedra.AAC.1
MLQERQARRRDLGEAYAPMLLFAPKAPTDLERFMHELTREPPEPWCEFCVLGNARQTAQDKDTGRP